MTATMEPSDKNNATLLLRLPDELKADLMRQAARHGRRITAEINIRLRESLRANSTPSIFDPPAQTYAPATSTVHTTDGKPPPPAVTQAPAAGLQRTEQALLRLFQSLPPEKQLALLTLLDRP